MKKHGVDFEYVYVIYYTERDLTEELARKLGSECFGLRKSMGECNIQLLDEDKEKDYKDITIIKNDGDFNIFKGNEYIDNIAYLYD